MSRLSLVLLLLSLISVFSVDQYQDDVQSVLTRFYRDFGHVYRSANDNQLESNNASIQYYRFVFTREEYAEISEESLTLLHADVLERTINFHPMPNFQVAGARYLYRFDARQSVATEIELVNVEDRLFREVKYPARYFYVHNDNLLQYIDGIPVLPFYEVLFKCNSSFERPEGIDAPVFSYIDRRLSWKARYIVEVPSLDSEEAPSLFAYADMRNPGDFKLLVKVAELVSGTLLLVIITLNV
jgi:hypothetical protein